MALLKACVAHESFVISLWEHFLFLYFSTTEQTVKYLMYSWMCCSVKIKCPVLLFINSLSHQTVSLQSFDQSAVCVLVQREAFGDVIQKVQIFKRGFGLLSFLLGCSPLVRGALQIELEVHAYRAR